MTESWARTSLRAESKPQSWSARRKRAPLGSRTVQRWSDRSPMGDRKILLIGPPVLCDRQPPGTPPRTPTAHSRPHLPTCFLPPCPQLPALRRGNNSHQEGAPEANRPTPAADQGPKSGPALPQPLLPSAPRFSLCPLTPSSTHARCDDSRLKQDRERKGLLRHWREKHRSAIKHPQRADFDSNNVWPKKRKNSDELKESNSQPINVHSETFPEE